MSPSTTAGHAPTNPQVRFNPNLDSWFIRDPEGRTVPSSERQVAGIYGQPFADTVKGGLAGSWVEFEAEPGTAPLLPRYAITILHGPIADVPMMDVQHDERRIIVTAPPELADFIATFYEAACRAADEGHAAGPEPSASAA